MNNRFGYVFIRNIYAGIIKETDEGYSFKYDKNYLDNYNSDVLLTMPLKEEEYTSNVLFPFFDGLIPEGFLLNVVTNNWKIDEKDRFGILLLTSKDTIGNVSIKEKLWNAYVAIKS